MSAQQSSPAALTAGNGSDIPDDGPRQPVEGVASGEPDLPLATAELANLLANGQWGETTNTSGAGGMDAGVYDGHVALALDTGVFPDIDSTHDLLTSSHHLFDVPALDVSSVPDDSSSA